MRLLDQIDSPADLRRLSRLQLRQLAQELREEIINTVSTNGGHLAPNLGVIELTLALHTVLDTPRDKLIWDVGHQAYAHKLLTGRRDRFSTLRQQGGLSGYPRREESPYDTFGVGHASTSISAALGMAVARDRKGEEHRVVAVIGDGALTGGMAYEALNHAGQLGTQLLVVLNDNEMSISPNVGAIAHYLNRLRIEPGYNRAKTDLKALARHLPGGQRAFDLASRVKDSVKHMLLPGALFEELGFAYFGPLDGHNIEELQRALRCVLKLWRPVLLHVITQKGKGYQPAENDPARYHGTVAFDRLTGRTTVKLSGPSYSAVFADTLVQLAADDPRIVAITAAMPDGTGLDRFAKMYPNRCFDVGIAEQHAVTFAAGLAASGLRPVVAIYSTFLQRAYDQVIHDVCLQRLPVIFALDRAGLVGEDGATHQGVFDLAYLRAVPNLNLAAPRDADELRSLLRTALDAGGPFAIRYPRGTALWRGGEVPPPAVLSQPIKPLAVGRGEVLAEGSRVALVAYGAMVEPARQAAALLLQTGITATVVNARFLKPLDEPLLVRVGRSHPLVVTLEEGVLAGGFGSAILELFATHDLQVPVLRLGVPDRFIEHASQAEQREGLGLTATAIAAAVRERLADGETTEMLSARILSAVN
ncbi:MAG: 1-deoxy-D-xylulose-5-phosphate synthase [Bacteroidota bacterium]